MKSTLDLLDVVSSKSGISLVRPKKEISAGWPEDVKVFHLPSYPDERGAFMRGFEKENFEALGLSTEWYQDNFSISKKGVFRGFHYQTDPFAQGKLVRIIQGRIIDFFIDLRPDSSSYLHLSGIDISAKNGIAVWIPRGFAHGFLSLENGTIMSYKCDNPLSNEHSTGFRYDDPCVDSSIEDIAKSLKIDKLIISDKDLSWKTYQKA
jgi:dTDP-4-dehydrorhamnose 3,5-epimerase